jgi:hypothetical protein
MVAKDFMVDVIFLLKMGNCVVMVVMGGSRARRREKLTLRFPVRKIFTRTIPTTAWHRVNMVRRFQVADGSKWSADGRDRCIPPLGVHLGEGTNQAGGYGGFFVLSPNYARLSSQPMATELKSEKLLGAGAESPELVDVSSRTGRAKTSDY